MEARLRLGELGAQLGVIDLQQHLTFFHQLALVETHPEHLPRNLGAELRRLVGRQ